MAVLWYLLLGIVIGIIARLILPGKENMDRLYCRDSSSNHTYIYLHKSG